MTTEDQALLEEGLQHYQSVLLLAVSQFEGECARQGLEPEKVREALSHVAPILREMAPQFLIQRTEGYREGTEYAAALLQALEKNEESPRVCWMLKLTREKLAETAAEYTEFGVTMKARLQEKWRMR